MNAPQLGTLDWHDLATTTELVAAPVAAAAPPGPAWVAPIDAELADTAAFCERYQVPLGASANCVIVEGRRGEQTTHAAVLVLATHRADVNKTVRKHLGVRKISFAPMETATSLTGMEYGGITPIGLPADWPVLVDEAVAAAGPVVIGAGVRAAKIMIDGADLARLPGAEVLALAQPTD
ncbi:YbaK/EbsC family protein [Naumannella cuiyingiana]|uniref:Prolyl-tRNA editing enzyme YbaK/EbsC (Cys-tRNA(Pro) deacylase) n=1 Tax=Naumannella cuiyingiana TaxID=1347891 RepID=A0A7Z0DAV0_9ACTN|nr:prolyl-tRNA editing enzyme YbaK/EbsC (Cys-tRNA(Pro) deacylase) [Naumannella cuiyingiana]